MARVSKFREPDGVGDSGCLRLLDVNDGLSLMSAKACSRNATVIR